MYSTFPTIAKYTPEVFDAACRQHKVTPEEFRLGTLKTVECYLDAFLENPLNDLHPDDRAVLEDLHKRVRLAIGDE